MKHVYICVCVYVCVCMCVSVTLSFLSHLYTEKIVMFLIEPKTMFQWSMDEITQVILVY